MADRARLPERFSYNLLLPSVQRSWDAHPDDCATLKNGFWYGRRSGGWTDISEVEYCTDCEESDDPDRRGTLFWVEHLTYSNWETAGPDEDDVFLCDCCNRKRIAALAEPTEEN
jgi:hypothetical protein